MTTITKAGISNVGWFRNTLEVTVGYIVGQLILLGGLWYIGGLITGVIVSILAVRKKISFTPKWHLGIVIVGIIGGLIVVYIPRDIRLVASFSILIALAVISFIFRNTLFTTDKGRK